MHACIAGMVCWLVHLVVTSDVSHRTQRTSRQEHASRVPGNQAGPATSLVSSSSRSRDEGKNAFLGFFWYCSSII